MTTPRCDACIYWRREDYPFSQVLPFRKCRRALEAWEATTWNDDEDTWEYEKRVLIPEAEGLKMLVNDGSQYRAELLTAPDFFCAHFEGKAL